MQKVCTRNKSLILLWDIFIEVLGEVIPVDTAF